MSSDRLDRGIVIISSVVVIGAIMSILDTTIVNVALATLSAKLHAPLSTIQWVATGYLVALAVVIPMTGWACERFGAKQLWMIVVGLFVAGSALSGLAWSAGSLIVFRVMQGLGGGMIMPAGMTILAQAAGPQRIGRVMSVVGAPMLLGPILGPVIGGLILEHLSWRWIFYVNLPIGALALALAFKLLPRSEPQPGERLDFGGFLLLSPGLAAIVFGLSETSVRGGLGYVGAWLPIAAGLALVAAFTRHATRASRPLLDLSLFRAPGFAASAATVLLTGAALFGAMLLLPLYLQVARGESTLHTGLLMAPQGIGAAVVMPLSGRLTDRIGGGPIVLFGMLVITGATIAMTAWGAHTSYWTTSINLFVRGIGFGCAFMPAMAAAFATISRQEVPRATTALNVLQRLGGSIGTALLAVVLEGRIKAALPSGGVIGGGTVKPLPPALRERLAVPLAHAFTSTFWWAVGLTAIAVAPAVVLAFTARRRAAAPAPEAVHAA
jgi:EmrB/QacA subfamily drug resistance transporter